MKKKVFTVTNIIIALPIFISSIALFISLYTCNNQNKQFQYLYDDNLEIYFIKSGFNHTTNFLDGGNKHIPSFFSVVYSVLITNKSSLPVSIISYDIIPNENDKIRVYNFFTEKFLNKEIPIVIDGKKSLTLDLIIYYNTTPLVNNILKKNFTYGTNPLFRDFKREVYKNGYDLFGNLVEFNEINDKFIIRFINDIIFPSKKLRLLTSWNRNFEKEIPYYQ